MKSTGYVKKVDINNPMKARMICDLNNDLSMKYAELSKKSFDGTGIEIELVQCVTPDTIKDQDFIVRWEAYLRTNKWAGKKRKKTLTEQACLTSHFREWKHIADTGERHIILEHDAYVHDKSKLDMLLAGASYYEMWNAGIAMECYTLSPRLARFMMLLYLEGNQRVCAGPMAELWTSLERWCILCPYVGDKNTRVLWPDHSNTNHLADASSFAELRKHSMQIGVQRAPVTQVFCPNEGRTLDHGEDIAMQYGGSTIRQMKVVDKL